MGPKGRGCGQRDEVLVGGSFTCEAFSFKLVSHFRLLLPHSDVFTNGQPINFTPAYFTFSANSTNLFERISRRVATIFAAALSSRSSISLVCTADGVEGRGVCIREAVALIFGESFLTLG